jgi:hypothetical protein
MTTLTISIALEVALPISSEISEYQKTIISIVMFKHCTKKKCHTDLSNKYRVKSVLSF